MQISRINNINIFKTKIQTNKINFTARKDEPITDTFETIDYREINSIDKRRSKKIDELKEDYKNGIDITEDKDKLIFSRIQIAIEDAKKFLEDYPEFESEKEDIVQTLIYYIVEKTEEELNGKNKNFTSNYRRTKDIFFENLLKKEYEDIGIIKEVSFDKIQDDMEISDRFDLEKQEKKDMANLPSIQDCQKDVILKKLVRDITEGYPDSHYNLTAKQKIALEYIFGINGKDETERNEIAQKLDVTPTRISELRDVSLRKLKDFLEDDYEDQKGKDSMLNLMLTD